MYPYRNSRFHASWNIGIAVMHSTGEHWGLGLDASYSQEGASFQHEDLRSSIQLSYVRLPLRVNYFFRRYGNDLRPRISVGPCLGVLLNDQDHAGYRTLDGGLSGSAGFSYRLLRGLWLTWDATYNHGLQTIPTNDPNLPSNGNIRADIGLMAGF
jgi:hypothetical protein